MRWQEEDGRYLHDAKLTGKIDALKLNQTHHSVHLKQWQNITVHGRDFKLGKPLVIGGLIRVFVTSCWTVGKD